MAQIEEMGLFDQRLGNQLHQLSELTETLTVRVLEIEERILKLEKFL